jgi:hypothetical protein
MSQGAPALLYQRRAPRIIAQEDLELRRRGLDDPTDLSGTRAPDGLRHWTRALELSFVFAAAGEAMARLGIEVVADIVRELKSIDDFVSTVTRLDVQGVLDENRQALDEVFGSNPPPADAPVPTNVDLVVRAATSLLGNCPIAALEQTGARHGMQELSHRCRLAFDGLTALIARNTQPMPSAVVAAGHAYAEGRLSIDEVAAVLGMGVPDAVALLEQQGFRRTVEGLRLTAEKRAERLRTIREDRMARAGATSARPDWVAREVIASQRIEDIDARPWLRS